MSEKGGGNTTLLACASALLLGACAVGPNFKPPRPQAPQHWSARALAGKTDAQATQLETASRADEQAAELRGWWNGFGDPVLSSLVERAMASNLDVRTALLRIEESRAQRAITAAALWPSLSLDASLSRERFSETTPTGAIYSTVGTLHLPGVPSIHIPNPYDQYQLGGTVSWEVDLFGRVRRAVEAAEANVQVAREDQRAVQVSVCADVATSYLELRGAQLHLRVTRENLATLEELLELTRKRRAAGLTSDIDVSNAAAESSALRADLPTFERQITQNINLLSQLLGREPEALRSELDPPVPLPKVPAQISIGLPADLARRRPDIREAEANLHAATAQIGVAIADLFPRLTLSADGGLQSETAGDLTKWASRFGSMGPGFTVPIFDRGLWSTVRLDEVRAQDAALAYQHTVLNALQEVENALAAYAADQERRAWLEATVIDNRDALALSRQRYEHGVINFIDVLYVQRTLQQNEGALADSTTAVTTDLVALYRALGGGWQDLPPATRATSPETRTTPAATPVIP